MKRKIRIMKRMKGRIKTKRRMSLQAAQDRKGTAA